MKVLHICSYYITSKLYNNLFTHLEKECIKEDVYIPVNSDLLINKYAGENNENIEYIYSKCFNKFDRISFRFKNKKIYKDINDKVDFGDVDISHAHSLFVNGYVAYKLKKEKGIDYIVAVRNTDVNVFFKKMIHLRKIGVEILKNAKKVIFISSKYRETVIDKYIPNELKEIIRQKSVVIPNGIDKFWFDNISMNDKVFESKDINLIYVGRVDKNKNLETSLKVLDKLSEYGYNIKFDIVGDGVELENIKSMVKKGCKANVVFHGFKSKEDIINLYRNSDIFIMPSKYETFGLVYVEALTQGLPLIYTKGQGFDGYFEEGEVGFSVVYDDVDDIVDKIIKITKKTWEFEKLQSRVEREFNWENIAKDYKCIYAN